MRGKRFSPQLDLRALPPWGPSLPWLCPVDSQVASFPGLVSPAEATASRSRDPGGTGILSVILRSLANGPELRGRGPRASTHLVLFHFDLRGDRNIGAVEEKAGDQRGEEASCLQAALRATLRLRGGGEAGQAHWVLSPRHSLTLLQWHLSDTRGRPWLIRGPSAVLGLFQRGQVENLLQALLTEPEGALCRPGHLPPLSGCWLMRPTLPPFHLPASMCPPDEGRPVQFTLRSPWDQAARLLPS